MAKQPSESNLGKLSELFKDNKIGVSGSNTANITPNCLFCFSLCSYNCESQCSSNCGSACATQCASKCSGKCAGFCGGGADDILAYLDEHIEDIEL